MHLVEVQGKTLNTKDIFAVLRRLIKNAETSGLCLEAAIGETVPYDQNRHDVIGAEGAVTAASRVTIRMPGASFRGKIIRKAAVEPYAS
jgi:hypothetical protein